MLVSAKTSIACIFVHVVHTYMNQIFIMFKYIDTNQCFVANLLLEHLEGSFYFF